MAERLYTIPLRREIVREGRIRRVPRSINFIREFVGKHSKAGEVKISRGLNELLWEGGIKRSRGRLKVKVEVKDGIAFVRLPEEKAVEKAKETAKAPEAAKEGKEKKPAGEKAADRDKEKTGRKLTPEEEAEQIWKEAEEKVKKEGKG